MGHMLNTRQHKDSDNPKANINPKTLPLPLPNKPTASYQTVLTLTNTVGFQCPVIDILVLTYLGLVLGLSLFLWPQIDGKYVEY